MKKQHYLSVQTIPLFPPFTLFERGSGSYLTTISKLKEFITGLDVITICHVKESTQVERGICGDGGDLIEEDVEVFRYELRTMCECLVY